MIYDLIVASLILVNVCVIVWAIHVLRERRGLAARARRAANDKVEAERIFEGFLIVLRQGTPTPATYAKFVALHLREGFIAWCNEAIKAKMLATKQGKEFDSAGYSYRNNPSSN